ncbi:MAG: RimK family alpha-L-glutamate ligase [Chloroflexi bacterium]|nr:RimK family alpha-L-glutamate ligase [Chloroflexota bacterium]
MVIFGTPEAWHSRALLRALKKRKVETLFANVNRLQARLGSPLEVLSENIPLSRFERALVREVPGGSLEQIIFRMDALHQLENTGMKVFNSPYAIEKMVDKYYTLSLLQSAGLPVPETLVMEGTDEAFNAYHRLGGDVVVKPLFGSRGVGMVRVSDAETAGRVFKALQLGSYVYYLQKFIPHGNRDLRVLVVGGECVASMERIADSWKTNIAAGGQPVAYKPSNDVREASLKAAQILGAEYCGVDLLRSTSGDLFILEVNSMPAWEGLQQVTHFDIAERIVNHCLR